MRLGAFVLAVGSLAGGAPLRAQHVHFGIGGGAIIPMSEYGANDQVGWHLVGIGEVGIAGVPVSVRADGMYGRTTHKGRVGGDSKLAGVTADLVWHARPLVKQVYLFAGIGAYNVNVEATGIGSTAARRVAFRGGLGTSARVAGAGVFGEAHLTSVRTRGGATDFIAISAGVAFGPGAR